MSEVAGLPHPYLLFLGDTTEKGYAKTAFGLRGRVVLCRCNGNHRAAAIVA